MKLVVTIPAQNEAPTVGEVVRAIPRPDPGAADDPMPGIETLEVIVVDDASTDATRAQAEAAGAAVVTMVGRPGLGPVWRLGMERAIRAGADVIVNLDADGQFDSRDVAAIVRPILDGEADFVACSRFADGGPVGYMPPVKLWGNRVVTWMTNRICGTSFTDVSCGFRAYNREAAYRLLQFGRWTYTEECVVYLVSRGLRMREMPFRVKGEREHGSSRVAGNVVYFASHLMHILLRAVRDGRPMRFFGAVALAALLPGGATLLFLLAWWLGTGAVAPFAGLLPAGAAATLIGFMLAALALLADMVSRHRLIHEELLYLARCRYYASPLPANAPPDSAALAGLFAEN